VSLVKLLNQQASFHWINTCCFYFEVLRFSCQSTEVAEGCLVVLCFFRGILGVALTMGHGRLHAIAGSFRNML